MHFCGWRKTSFGYLYLRRKEATRGGKGSISLSLGETSFNKTEKNEEKAKVENISKQICSLCWNMEQIVVVFRVYFAVMYKTCLFSFANFVKENRNKTVSQRRRLHTDG